MVALGSNPSSLLFSNLQVRVATGVTAIDDMLRDVYSDQSIDGLASMRDYLSKDYRCETMTIIYRGLEKRVIDCIKCAEHSVTVICPFIKVGTLHRILDARGSSIAVTIICTWKLENFVAGVCDVDLFPYCSRNDIRLLAHNRLHLKAWIFDREKLLLGSANVTDRGLSDSLSSNYEFMVYAQASGVDLDHFDHIRDEATEVDEDIYSRTVNALDRYPSGQEVYEDLIPDSSNTVALVDQLPLTPSPEALWDEYARSINERSLGAIHDLDRLCVPPHLDRDSFFQIVDQAFFALHIVIAFLQRVTESPVYFGESKALLQKLNESDPKPTRRDLTPITQNLFCWLEELTPDRFIVDRPSHSQRLTMMS
jgi:hypothetical protein